MAGNPGEMPEISGVFLRNDSDSPITILYEGDSLQCAPRQYLKWTRERLSHVNVVDPDPLPPPIKVLAKAPTPTDFSALATTVDPKDNEIVLVDIQQAQHVDLTGIDVLADTFQNQHTALLLRLVER